MVDGLFIIIILHESIVSEAAIQLLPFKVNEHRATILGFGPVFPRQKHSSH